ncbi:MAG: ATP-binding protein [Caulobacteraceae bacterium]
MTLVLVSLLAAQTINFWIIFNFPTPPPEIYRMTEITSVLKAGGKPVKMRNGRMIAATEQKTVRPPRTDRLSGFERNLGTELARRMDLPRSDVSLSLLLAQRGQQAQAIRLMREQMGDEKLLDVTHFVIAPFEASVRQPDGHWLMMAPQEEGMLSNWQQRILMWFGISVLALTPVAYLFARRLAMPIAHFAAAADRLGRDPGGPPLKLKGPAEIGVAVAAFNNMQERLRRYVQDRTAMIGAIAHDLRTPLTRLRFRVESTPEPLQTKMANDIDQMDAMISATLAFVRDATQAAERRPLELSSLVESAADETAETGADIEMEPGPQVVVEGDPIALRRLVNNLIDNALKFGGRARARVYAEEGSAVIEVDDEGPGLPDSEKEKVFEPFYRGEPSRSRETGGAGLGLAVVRSIARAHGGDAVLENRPGGGLRARARLPL